MTCLRILSLTFILCYFVDCSEYRPDCIYVYDISSRELWGKFESRYGSCYHFGVDGDVNVKDMAYEEMEKDSEKLNVAILSSLYKVDDDDDEANSLDKCSYVCLTSDLVPIGEKKYNDVYSVNTSETVAELIERNKKKNVEFFIVADKYLIKRIKKKNETKYDLLGCFINEKGEIAKSNKYFYSGQEFLIKNSDEMKKDFLGYIAHKEFSDELDEQWKSLHKKKKCCCSCK